MFGSALRALSILTGLTVASVIIGVLYGRSAGYIALLCLAVVPMALWLWLPRVAHSAFRRGDYGRARRLYRTLRAFSLSAHARAAIDVSVAACAMATAAYDTALQVLARVDRQALGEAGRAAWLNNRAYALVRSGGDAEAAMRACEEAIEVRPDVAGFRHTRGVVLLALGRIDDAIHELERLWDHLAVGDASAEHALLEAERCYDLGVAWEAKGDAAYAADYFQRAHQTAPGSRWAERAFARVGPFAGSALDELLEHDGDEPASQA